MVEKCDKICMVCQAVHIVGLNEGSWTDGGWNCLEKVC